jgi:hypothetical protein
MAAATLEHETAVRRARIEAVMADIQESERKRLEQEALATDEQLRNRLMFLKHS